MFIKQIISSHRYDFSAVMECEHCGHQQVITTGYDDANYHNNVIPKMTCAKCMKDRAGCIPAEPNEVGNGPMQKSQLLAHPDNEHLLKSEKMNARILTLESQLMIETALKEAAERSSKDNLSVIEHQRAQITFLDEILHRSENDPDRLKRMKSRLEDMFDYYCLKDIDLESEARELLHIAYVVTEREVPLRAVVLQRGSLQPVQGVHVWIAEKSGDPGIVCETLPNGVLCTSFQYKYDLPVIIRVRKVGIVPFEEETVITSSGLEKIIFVEVE